MSILSTEKVGHHFHDKFLFQSISIGLQQGSRVALVGNNGTGKSTLLKILAGKIPPAEGQIAKQRGLRVGYLPQETRFNVSTVEDFIYSQDDPRQQLIRKYDKALESGDSDNLQEIMDELTSLDAWTYEHEIKNILGRFSIQDMKHRIEDLSGGQKKRLNLAKLLIDEPDVYLLDEPTNHLDIQTIEWLEKYLTSGNKTLLMITHDRYFLDRVCNEIFEIARGEIFSHKGNYGYFLEKKFEREEGIKQQFQKNKNTLKTELEWMRRQPKARGTKSKSRIQAYESLAESQNLLKEKEANLQLSVRIQRQGNKILEVENLNKSFASNEIIKNFSYVFKKGDRIGIAGQNGSGKSTFLKLLTGQIPSDNGTVIKGETTFFGYFEQEYTISNESERVIDSVKSIAEHIELSNGNVVSASQLLNQFLFSPEKQFTPIFNLSGGERKRLQLLHILIRNPNFLILDEPTNDLDLETLSVLEDFLINFSGVVLLVSHDRYLIDRICDQLFILNGSGDVLIFNGNYSDYLTDREESEIVEKKRKLVQMKDLNESSKQKLTYAEQLEVQELERVISLREDKIKDLNSSLSNTVQADDILDLVKQLETEQIKLNEDTERWVYLSEINERST